MIVRLRGHSEAVRDAHAPGLDRAALCEAMSRDKKNQKGKTRFVLPHGIGRVELTDQPCTADIRAVLEGL